MKQVATKRHFYVSPILPSYRCGSQIDKRKIFSPWKSKNNTLGCNDKKMVKEIAKPNIREVFSIKPLHYTPNKSNRSDSLGATRFRPQQVRATMCNLDLRIIFFEICGKISKEIE